LCEQGSQSKDAGLTYSGSDTWTGCCNKASSCWSASLRTSRSHSAPSYKPAGSVHSNARFWQQFRLLCRCIGELDGTPCVLEWKTSSARYPEEPAGIPHWIRNWSAIRDDRHRRSRPNCFRAQAAGRSSVLSATISEQQRQEFASLVDDTVRRIDSGWFLPHNGIRFPQNPCTTCPFVGLCLDKSDLVETALVRKPGVDLVCLTNFRFRPMPMPPSSIANALSLS